jgi:hypothetical protein
MVTFIGHYFLQFFAFLASLGKTPTFYLVMYLMTYHGMTFRTAAGWQEFLKDTEIGRRYE